MQTAEKSPPSALDFLAQFQAASAGLMKNGRRLPQSMALTQCIQEYNKTVNVKRWRVDAAKKAIVLSLAQCPKAAVDLLAAHYDAHKHTQSGLTGRGQCFWVHWCPGSRSSLSGQGMSGQNISVGMGRWRVESRSRSPVGRELPPPFRVGEDTSDSESSASDPSSASASKRARPV